MVSSLLSSSSSMQTALVMQFMIALIHLDGGLGFKFGPPLFTSSVINLEDFPNYSTFSPLLADKVTASIIDISNEKIQDWKNHKLLIRAPEPYRIMMIIQVINLHTGQGENMTLNKESCDSSLQVFEHEQLTSETCGRVNWTDKSLSPSEMVGRRTYLSKGSSLILSLHIGKFLQDYIHFISLGHPIKLKLRDAGLLTSLTLGVSFTAFQACEDVGSKENYMECASRSHLEMLDEDTVPCVNVNLRCDGILNCGVGYNHKNIGRDEDEEVCSGYRWYNKGTSGTQDRYHHRAYEVINSTSTRFRPTDGSQQFGELFVIAPSTTVLLIILTILSVMIVGIVIRLGCTKCVGTPKLPLASLPLEVTNRSGAQQCSRYDPEKDAPPSYDELFPSGDPLESQKNSDDFPLSPLSNHNVGCIVINEEAGGIQTTELTLSPSNLNNSNVAHAMTMGLKSEDDHTMPNTVLHNV